jgi:hypothetical protein
MDYEKMKALMEGNRGESALHGNLSVKELPRPEPRPDWKYPADTVAKERMAA